jgi:hypothetical protein
MCFGQRYFTDNQTTESALLKVAKEQFLKAQEERMAESMERVRLSREDWNVNKTASLEEDISSSAKMSHVEPAFVFDAVQYTRIAKTQPSLSFIVGVVCIVY